MQGPEEQIDRRPRIYLAGPEVFLRDPMRAARAKQKLCDAYGFVGVSPVDNHIDTSALPKRRAGFAISAANEEMLRTCHLLIANLTPFRGPSADPGTVYELGFARAIGLPVFGYTNVRGSLLDRTKKYLGDHVRPRPETSGAFEDNHHMVIEDFNLTDNLMLEGALHGSGTEIVVTPTRVEQRFTDLSGFETCLRLAASQLGLLQPPERARNAK